MHRSATLCGGSAQAVLNGIRTFAQAHYEKPRPEGKAVILELDELWHDVKKNGTNSGSGKRWILGQVDGSTGNVAAVTKPR
jgi:transposase